MKVQRGDVVLVDYVYSDRTGSKVRPCLVVQNDSNNARLDDTIVVTISTNTRLSRTEPTQLLVDLNTPVGRQSGLLHTSAVQCENILTIDCQFVFRKIGVPPADAMDRVNDCLKASLALA